MGIDRPKVIPLTKGQKCGRCSPPWRLMITYKRHRYIHLTRQIVCMWIPDNAIFCLVGLDQHGIYIYICRHLEQWFMLSIIIAHANLQWKTNGGFYAHVSQRAWTGRISFKLNIPINGQPSTCFFGIIHVYFIWILYLRCIIYSYK